ncbi:MAG TPA: bifunctional molybdenum cofactor biosynthesis protein MoaC/MoaB [Nitrososphaeraceae archaeon]|nr:bifunctional molybdenum cofactor biosynthesis protein MoaC/MoaB [Nitrososphaeraceae archaeon]
MKEGMYDISNKAESFRTAIAQAMVKMKSDTIALIHDGKSPKGNIFEAVRFSATMAAKRTWELIPYCHPIPIDSVRVDVSLRQQYIELIVEVKNISKTGVEMEALTAASIGALTIYDMLKPVDEKLSIESIKLLNKSGGLSTYYELNEVPLRAAVLVTSDSRGEKEDSSGKMVKDRLTSNGFIIIEYQVIPNKSELIECELKRFCDELKLDIVITCGGTGVGPSDVTPEATKNILEKELCGISETLRIFGQRRTPFSMLSRGLAGIRGTTVIINLPGSVRAVSESLDSLFPGIMHIFKMIKGRKH